MSTTAPPTPPQARPDPTGRPGVLGDRYHLLERIDSGGMGEVFRARDAVLERDVAVKLLHAGLAADPGFVGRFRREAQAAASLHHPNVVDVYDWGDEHGTPYMVMELVRGVSLRRALAAAGRLDPGRAAWILDRILAALERAHAAGIVHLDLKPENVLLDADGTVKVADFGLARATDATTVSTHTLIGTAQYLAPERIRGAAPYPAADLYAVGIVAWELLVGRAPFQGATVFAVAEHHLTDVPAPPSSQPGVSDALDVWIAHLVAKDPADRPPTAAAARDELEAFARELPIAEGLPELVVRAHGEVTNVPTHLGPHATRAMTAVLAPAPKGSRRGGRRFRLARVLAAVLVPIAAVAGLAFSVARARTATIPEVRGRTLDRAEAMLEDAGFEVRVAKWVYSSAIAEGSVVRLDPPSGAALAPGQAVELVPSLGPRPVSVPELVGRSLSDAKAALSEVGLVPGDIVRAFHDSVPAGVIAVQSVASTHTAPKGSEIDLTVSRGPKPFAVPDVVGLSEDDAVAALSALGLDVVVTDASFLGFTGSVVVDQWPAAQSTLRAGDTVELFLD